MSGFTEVSQSGQVVPDGSTSKKINSLLNCSKTRLEGLRLLDLFFPHCPDEEFLNSCVNWMQNCCKTDGVTKNTNYPIRLLCKLLKTASNYPELKKSVSFFITTRYFDFFFKYLTNAEVGWICTEICLCLYRGACGPFQDTLEKHLTNEIEKNVNILPAASRCFALLPSSGGGGSDGLNYKRNWKNQFVKFLSICHSVLNDLFADVEDFQEYAALEHRHSTNGSNGDIEHLAILFQNCCSVLASMLINQYPAPKNVPSDLVFQLICRGLAVNPKALGRRSQTTSLLSVQKVLPEIHRALFSLLKAVIVTCKNQLLPYSHLICKLIKQSLQWTESDFSCGDEQPLERVRISTYECLCDWLVVARSGSCVELISDVIVSNAANDVRSKEGVIFLKAKRQTQAQSRRQASRHATVNGELCRAALRALQFLLKFAGVLLKPEMHKFLQEIVIKLLVEIQRGSPSDFVVPLAVPTFRVGLYSVLLELVQQPCLKWPPPTSFALRLFSGGLNDNSPEVSSFCSAALNFTTIIIHPQYDNGGFPSCSSPGSRIQELRWREVMEVDSEPGSEIFRLNNENLARSDDTCPSKKVSDATEGTEISSDEDSRNTVTFSKDVECGPEMPRMEDGGREEISVQDTPAEVYDSDARERIIPEKAARQEIPSPVREDQLDVGSSSSLGQTPENSEMKKVFPSRHVQHPDNSKNISPESGNEGDHPKGRYFLRSTTKGSSEEPEEALKRTNSVESLKGTPAKGMPKVSPSAQNSTKRPRTRALSKIEGSEETETKAGQDDEDDLRAAFDDSFVD